MPRNHHEVVPLPLTDGGISTWGSNSFCELENGTLTSSAAPIQARTCGDRHPEHSLEVESGPELSMLDYPRPLRLGNAIDFRMKSTFSLPASTLVLLVYEPADSGIQIRIRGATCSRRDNCSDMDFRGTISRRRPTTIDSSSETEKPLRSRR